MYKKRSEHRRTVQEIKTKQWCKGDKDSVEHSCAFVTVRIIVIPHYQLIEMGSQLASLQIKLNTVNL